VKLDDLKGAAIGLGYGIVLSRIGFSSWDHVHAMFTFSAFDLLISFCVAVILLTVGWRVISAMMSEPPVWPTRAMHPGTLWGGVLFGAGWALCGACPSIVIVQLGEGQLMAVWTLGGILVGNWLYAAANERWLHWDTGSCLDD
jgi:uncharacterized membrane protein YedE/YeeE